MTTPLVLLAFLVLGAWSGARIAYWQITHRRILPGEGGPEDSVPKDEMPVWWYLSTGITCVLAVVCGVAAVVLAVLLLLAMAG